MGIALLMGCNFNPLPIRVDAALFPCVDTYCTFNIMWQFRAIFKMYCKYTSRI